MQSKIDRVVTEIDWLSAVIRGDGLGQSSAVVGLG
jgi:hypothetical protein